MQSFACLTAFTSLAADRAKAFATLSPLWTMDAILNIVLTRNSRFPGPVAYNSGPPERPAGGDVISMVVSYREGVWGGKGNRSSEYGCERLCTASMYLDYIKVRLYVTPQLSSQPEARGTIRWDNRISPSVVVAQ